ncbi:hypothetical protein ACH3XW_18760 [Acanthocheilonema viteae]
MEEAQYPTLITPIIVELKEANVSQTPALSCGIIPKSTNIAYICVGRFDAIRYGDHFVISELQASFVVDKANHTRTNSNCNFNYPYFMKGNIILDVDNNTNEILTTPNPENQLIMMKLSTEETIQIM